MWGVRQAGAPKPRRNVDGDGPGTAYSSPRTPVNPGSRANDWSFSTCTHRCAAGGGERTRVGPGALQRGDHGIGEGGRADRCTGAGEVRRAHAAGERRDHGVLDGRGARVVPGVAEQHRRGWASLSTSRWCGAMCGYPAATRSKVRSIIPSVSSRTSALVAQCTDARRCDCASSKATRTDPALRHRGAAVGLLPRDPRRGGVPALREGGWCSWEPRRVGVGARGRRGRPPVGRGGSPRHCTRSYPPAEHRTNRMRQVRASICCMQHSGAA